MGINETETLHPQEVSRKRGEMTPSPLMAEGRGEGEEARTGEPTP